MSLFPSKSSLKWPKWSSIPSWLLTEVRTEKGISVHLPTFSGRRCLLSLRAETEAQHSIHTHQKGWWSSGYRRALQKAANWSSSPGLQEEIQHLYWTSAVGEGQWQDCPCGHSAQQGGYHQSKTGKDHTKILEHKAKSCQGAKEKGKYKEETTEKMRE